MNEEELFSAWKLARQCKCYAAAEVIIAAIADKIIIKNPVLSDKDIAEGQRIAKEYFNDLRSRG